MDNENKNLDLEAEESEENLEQETIETDEEIEESSQEETESKEEESSKDYVPLKSHLKIKDENKELRRKLAQMEEKQYEESVVLKKQQIFNEWKAKGYDDSTAELMASQIANIYTEFANINKEKQKTYIDMEIDDLEKNTLYEGISNYKSQIKENIEKARKAGVTLTVQQAYVGLVDIGTRVKEVNTKNEVVQRLKNKGKKSTDTLMQTSSSSGAKQQYDLTTEEKVTLAELKKMQPDRGWTAKKYYELLKKPE